MTPEQKALEVQLRRMKSYFPYRIVWGYVDEQGLPQVFANTTWHRANAEARKGKMVYVAN